MRLYGFTARIYNRNLSTFRLRPPFRRVNNKELVVLSCCCAFQTQYATNVVSWKQRVYVEATWSEEYSSDEYRIDFKAIFVRSSKHTVFSSIFAVSNANRQRATNVSGNTVQQEKVARRCRFGERFDRRATHDAPSLHHAQFMPTLNGLRAMRAEFCQHSQNLALNLNNSAAVLPHRYLSRIKYMRKVGQIS